MSPTKARIEMARFDSRNGRRIMTGYQDADGTYSYDANGAYGRGLDIITLMKRFQDAREWPGGKTAILTLWPVDTNPHTKKETV